MTRHTEKPVQGPIHCNVDRDFNFSQGGYIKVWFAGDAEPCDPSTGSKPEECGIRYLTIPHADAASPAGFEVTAPAGKILQKVEHYSTLHLTCGGSVPTEPRERFLWNSTLGWDASLPADGTYSRSSVPKVVPGS